MPPNEKLWKWKCPQILKDRKAPDEMLWEREYVHVLKNGCCDVITTLRKQNVESKKRWNLKTKIKTLKQKEKENKKVKTKLLCTCWKMGGGEEVTTPWHQLPQLNITNIFPFRQTPDIYIENNAWLIVIAVHKHNPFLGYNRNVC